jgi:hypothetical protein
MTHRMRPTSPKMVYAMPETKTAIIKNITPLLLQFQDYHQILLSICSGAGDRGHWPVVLGDA